MGRSSLVDDKIWKAWSNLVSLNINVNHFNFLLFITFEFNPDEAMVYEKKILFNWKSEKKDFRYIQRSAKIIISSPFNSYVVYDVAIKFFVAITHYELNVLYNFVISNNFIQGSWCKDFSDFFNEIMQESRFPFDYKCILMMLAIF